MPIGPGIYDPLCTYVREMAEARAAIVIVVNGNKGSGFAMQSHEYMSTGQITNMLQGVIDELRAAGGKA